MSKKEPVKKVEFLYSGNKIDRDAYLLGKPIDKALMEKETNKPKEESFVNTVDLAAKIREDPLFEIKKREIESKKRLLENPERLRQISQQLMKPGSKNPHPEKEVDSASSSQDDNDSDDNNQKKDRKRSHHETSNRHANRDNVRYSSSRDRNHQHGSYNSRKDKSRLDNSREYEKNEVRSSRRHSNHRSRSRSHDKVRERLEIERLEKEKKNGFGLINRRKGEDAELEKSGRNDDGEKTVKQLEIEKLKRDIERMKKKSEIDKTSDLSSHRGPRKKLTEEEKQKRLFEMQDNAKWREDVRSTNMSKYRREEKHESRLHEESTSKKSQASATHLFNNLMNDAYSSKEDRIKRNIKNIDRSKN